MRHWFQACFPYSRVDMGYPVRGMFRCTKVSLGFLDRLYPTRLIESLSGLFSAKAAFKLGEFLFLRRCLFNFMFEVPRPSVFRSLILHPDI